MWISVKNEFQFGLEWLGHCSKTENSGPQKPNKNKSQPTPTCREREREMSIHISPWGLPSGPRWLEPQRWKAWACGQLPQTARIRQLPRSRRGEAFDLAVHPVNDLSRSDPSGGRGELQPGPRVSALGTVDLTFGGVYVCVGAGLCPWTPSCRGFSTLGETPAVVAYLWVCEIHSTLS